jgi:sugar lactone lactonase YvrE
MVRVLALLLMCVVARSAMAQAPYVLPYNMATVVGPAPYRTVTGPAPYNQLPQPCAAGLPSLAAAGSNVAFTTTGDGCLASQASSGSADTHDIRVDGLGYVYWMDENSSSNIVFHKYDPRSGIMTVYAGAGTGGTAEKVTCSDTQGSGCILSDNLGNLPTDCTPTSFSTVTQTCTLPYIIGGAWQGYTKTFGGRGIYVTPNSDLYIFGYTQDAVWKLNYLNDQSAGVVAGVAGAAAALVDNVKATQGKLNQDRGGAVDANGTIWIGSTQGNEIQEVPFSGPNAGIIFAAGGSGSSSPATGIANPAGCTVGAAGTGPGGVVTHTIFNAPEAIVVDTNGNIYVSNTGSGQILSLYEGTGNLINVANPITGTWYASVGQTQAGGCTAVSGTTRPSVPGTLTSGALFGGIGGVRKFTSDSHNNLYLGDGNNQAIWMVDAVTGYGRLIAGSISTASQNVPCTLPEQPAIIGDGCAAAGKTKIVYANSNVTADAFGNLFFGDNQSAAATGITLATNNARIREVTNGLTFYAPLNTNGTTLNANGTIVPAPIPISPVAGPVNSQAPTQTIEVHVNPTLCQPGNPAACQAEGATSPGTQPANPINATFTITGNTNDFKMIGTPQVVSESGPWIGGTAPLVAGTTPTPANVDMSEDYLIQVQFAPTAPGLETAQLVVTTASGLKSSFGLSGVGGGSSVAIDPGSVTKIPAATAAFNKPAGAFTDGSGNYYIADQGANRVFVYNATANTTTLLAGNGTAGFGGDGAPATLGMLSGPTAVTVDTAGNVYIADTGNNRIRRVDAGSGFISTYAGGGNGTFCNTVGDAVGNGCPATQAILNQPDGVAIDTLNNLFVSEAGANDIRRFSNTTFGSPYSFQFAGGTNICNLPGADGLGDGCTVVGSTPTFTTGVVFNAPAGLAIDSNFNLYIADKGDNAVRKINISSTLATSLLNSSQVKAPTGVAVDAAGNVYVADTGNNDVRVFSTAGVLSTIMGIAGSPGTGAATGTTPAPTATQVQLGISSLGGVAVSGIGTLLVTDPGAAGGGRVLLDNRTSTAFNFGNTADGTGGLPVPFTELSTGNTAAALGAPSFTPAAPANNFNLTGSCTSASTLASGTACGLTATFTPTAPGALSQTFTESNATAIANLNPQIALSGTGATLAATTTSFTQTSPPGSPNFGTPVVLQATVTCSTPTTGNVFFSIDGALTTATALTSNGTGGTVPVTLSTLPSGTHTLVLEFGGDSNCAQSVSAPATIIVNPPLTTTHLTITPNVGTATTAQQFTNITYVATLDTNPSGLSVPAGTVDFVVTPSGGTPTVLGTAPVLANGTATFVQKFVLATNGQVDPTTTTFVPGTYGVVADYNCVGLPAGAPACTANAGFIASNSGAQTANLIVQPQTTVAGTNPASPILLTSKPCNAANQLLVTVGVGAPTLPKFTCADDPGFPGTLTTGSTTALLGGIATPILSGTAGGTMTGVTLCPYNNSNGVVLTLPVQTADLQSGGKCAAGATLNPANFLVAAVFNEPNTFTAGQVVTVTGATTQATPTTTAPNNAAIYNVTYTVIQATSTQWSGVLTSYVGTGQGAAIDATVFVQPTNTLTGTLTFTCSHLPANSACTFNPTFITLAPSPTEPQSNVTVTGSPYQTDSPYIPVVVTIFTDLQPGQGNSNSSTGSLHAPGTPGHKASGVSMALLLGWPITLAGLAGLIRFRKRKGLASSLTLTALLCMMLGSSVLFTAGCGSYGGPGAYVANLTPTGIYPVVVTVSNGTVSQSITINLAVFPGQTGSE